MKKTQTLIDRAREAAKAPGPEAKLIGELALALAKYAAKEEIRKRDAAVQTGNYVLQLPANAREAVIQARVEARREALAETGVSDDYRVADVWRNDNPDLGRPGRLMFVAKIERPSPQFSMEPCRPEDAVGFNASAENLLRAGWVRVEKAGEDDDE